MKTTNRVVALLERLRVRNEQDQEHGAQTMQSAEPLVEIATLAPGVSRPLSPMLQARFEFCAAWTNAHLSFDWLSLSAISTASGDPRIKELVDLRIENSDDDLLSRVPPENCALFAINPDCLDEVYLAWEEGQEEPTVWEYFGADEHSFHDICRYLEFALGERDTDDNLRDAGEKA